MKRLAALLAVVSLATLTALTVPPPASAAYVGGNCNPLVDTWAAGTYQNRAAKMWCAPLGTVVGVWLFAGWLDGGGGPGPRPY